MSWELYIAPELPKRNAVTGRFMKGHVPANKGKKWAEWMGKRAQKRAARGWVNLQKYRPKTRADNAGRCRKPVVAVTDGGKWCVFPFIRAAAEWCAGSRDNVRRCCVLNAAKRVSKRGLVNTDHKYMGVRFYWESDNDWTKKIQT